MFQTEKFISTKQIYLGTTISLSEDMVELPDGQTTIREVVKHSDVVAMVAIDHNENVLMVRQFRYSAGKSLLEIPAGGIEPREQPLNAVRRELQEEIGYLPRRIVSLGGFYAVPGYSTQYYHCYLTTGLIPSQLTAEDTESIEIVKIPLKQLEHCIISGEIGDAKSTAALLLFLLWKKEKNFFNEIPD
jgi:ADP-ribose pyrophosphatase